jgi:hypothetical protein
MSDIKIEYTDKEISAYGGIVLLKKMMDQMHFTDFLSKTPLPVQGSNRGYDPVQLILQFISSVWCGASRFEHLEITRFDGVLKELYGWEKMAGHRAFVRYFQKFDQHTNNKVFENFYHWFFDNLRFDNFTLDLDSSVFTRYGDQQGAEVGFNPKKRGRKSHHPLLAFIADAEMVANFWLRGGAAHTANNFEAFLVQTLAHLQNKKIGLLRADSGFYDRKIFELLEKKENSISYIIACPMYQTIQRKIHSQKTWLKLDDGIEIADTTYQSDQWKDSRRLIIVRQKIAERPKAIGKQLKLYQQDDQMNRYRYSCYITNLTLPAPEVWRLYRNRATCENRIKELKYDYAADKINQRDFFATETTLNFIMIAYNLMSLFRQVVIQDQVRPTLKTIRLKALNIGSYIVQNGRDQILKMAVRGTRRNWITELWNRIDKVEKPFIDLSG